MKKISASKFLVMLPLFTMVTFSSFTNVFADGNNVAPGSAGTCSSSPVGSSTKINPTIPYFSDPAAGQYTLNRTGQKQFEIVLNYDFNPVYPPYVEFVSSCFKRMSQYLVGPNGEQVSIRLPNASDTSPPKGHPVTISPQCGYRGEAMCWTPQYDCPTLFHETMHHLGLVDEYVDHSGYAGSSANCRAPGPLDSLMTNPTSGDRAVENSYHMEVYRCNNPSNLNCQKVLDTLEAGGAVTLPSRGYVEVPSVSTSNADWAYNSSYDYSVMQEHLIGDRSIRPVLDLAAMENTPKKYDPDYAVSVIDYTPEGLQATFEPRMGAKRISPTRLEVTTLVKGKKPSILYPAEFTAIVYPSCGAANGQFAACSKNAYSSHFCSVAPACSTLDWVNVPAGVNFTF